MRVDEGRHSEPAQQHHDGYHRYEDRYARCPQAHAQAKAQTQAEAEAEAEACSRYNDLRRHRGDSRASKHFTCL